MVKRIWRKYAHDPTKVSKGYHFCPSAPRTRKERKLLYGTSHHLQPFASWKGTPSGLFRHGDIRKRMLLFIADVLADMSRRNYKFKWEEKRWRDAYRIWQETSW